MTQPAGVTAAVGHGHPVPRAGELHRAPVHVLRPQAARAAGALLRRRTRSRTCGRRRRCRCSRRRSGSAVRDGDDVDARGEMAMAATFAGLGFGNAGVHIPHANAYPIAGRVRGLPPRGLPRRRADGAARDGGLADRAGGVPVHLRVRPRAAPPRRRAARARTTTTTRARTLLPRRAHRPDARHRASPTGSARSATTTPTCRPGRGHAASSSGCSRPRPRDVDEEAAAGILSRSMELW